METFLIAKEAGGHEDLYWFSVGTATVEVIHEEDGEIRSEQYLETATAHGLWSNLKNDGYVASRELSVSETKMISSIVASSEPSCRGLVFGALSACLFWVCIGIPLLFLCNH
jgi:hypothetical protein